MSDWKPIETAPKDGTTVDLIINGDRAVNCKYLSGEWVDWDERENKYCWAGDPSHWAAITIPSPRDSK